jgi:hypothetical protein
MLLQENGYKLVAATNGDDGRGLFVLDLQDKIAGVGEGDLAETRWTHESSRHIDISYLSQAI